MNGAVPGWGAAAPVALPVGELAARLRWAGEALAAAAADVRRVDPGPSAFGADGPGALGELGLLLYRRWDAALHARADEATRHGARLVEAADGLRSVTDHYAAVDDQARAELIRVSWSPR